MSQVTNIYKNNPEQPNEIINIAVVLQLQEGQEVWVQPDTMESIYGITSGGMRSWFSGHLVYSL